MGDPNQPIPVPLSVLEGLCDSLRGILTVVYIVQCSALLLGTVYFLMLVCASGEPRPRVVEWGGSPALWRVIYAKNTTVQDDWWSMSISEYSAARGSSGAKLLGSLTAALGVLQVLAGPLLVLLCVAEKLSAAFLLVGGLCAIILGGMESSDTLPAEEAPVRRMKSVYGIIHTIAALLFIGFTATATLLISIPRADNDGFKAAEGLAISGLATFLVFCCLQALSGTYILSPAECLLPQRPQHRNPTHRLFGRVHAWLSRPSSLTTMGRMSICLELASFFFVAAGPILVMIIEAARGGPCSTCTEDDPRGTLGV